MWSIAGGKNTLNRNDGYIINYLYLNLGENMTEPTRYEVVDNLKRLVKLLKWVKSKVNWFYNISEERRAMLSSDKEVMELESKISKLMEEIFDC